MRKRFWKGLRTIDVVILGGIICMVLGIVGSRYDQFKCRSIQSEAKFALEEIYAAQKIFHEEHGHYATMEILLKRDARVFLPQRYYMFSDLAPPTKDNFLVGARGVDGFLISGEEWSIDQKKHMNLLRSQCKKP